MKVTRGMIVQRGLHYQCPNCGKPTLYVPGQWFGMEKACSHCGMRWDTDQGAFLGSATLNYGISVFGLIVPGMAIAFALGASTMALLVGAVVGTILIPILLYRPTKSWWLMCYYYFLPQNLPANRLPAEDGLNEEGEPTA